MNAKLNKVSLNFKKRFLNRKGISPVVGSVLLIVITVVVASIIATFVLPLVNDKLGESKACLNVLDSVEFAESSFNCYVGGSSTGYENGFSVKIKKDGVKGFRVSLLDKTTGSSQVYDISNSVTLPNVRMVGSGNLGYDSQLEFPNSGGQRSYVVKQPTGSNPYTSAEISPVLEDGQVCAIADKVNFKPCSTSVAL